MTVREATTILVLKEGRVIERGTHFDLVTRDGTYAALYRLCQGHDAAFTVAGSDCGPHRAVAP